MNLVVFPGGGSPGNPKYASVYRLLELEATKYGYTSTDSPLRWPGHDKNGLLTQDGAMQIANAAYYGIGAYAAALLWTKLGWGFFPGLVAGGLVAGVIRATSKLLDFPYF